MQQVVKGVSMSEQDEMSKSNMCVISNEKYRYVHTYYLFILIICDASITGVAAVDDHIADGCGQI